MKSGCGVWKVGKGKGNRHYIHCDNAEKVAHPDQLCDINGVCIYGYENLKDLAIAILRFEAQKNKSESIIENI